MTKLLGKTVAIAATRKTDEMSRLVEKQGGVPIVRSTQGTVFTPKEKVVTQLRGFIEEPPDWVVLTTGIGVETSLTIAREHNLEDAFLDLLTNTSIAARGYKTKQALKKLDLQPVVSSSDGTLNGLTSEIEGISFYGKRVGIQLHGENAPDLVSWFKEKGAEVTFLLPYEHTPPEQPVVEQLVREMVSHEVDAILFTSAIQVRQFFTAVREMDALEGVLDAFHSKVVATAVGQVTAGALFHEGVQRVVSPEHERMGAMVVALTKHYEDIQ
ncbi:uroporphyrinogen-III synthase [Pontibacillus halophilus JSM 076056 = DSM 19796]|uniref:Uroporphyrinogen-III synthase n=1 Tax=Pontibacillus halophilus JSM 076056 = DSM 19796 TaxID=1385510 RepID=A0A0A5IAW0_9BACI|nr:uroporphyrinogen-III synthase [Pontibacillus halophilus]KGX92967.1 uroporphyrinogen-III synthase [Pontibacillus halophilus JSM 076056 = DSM 19796]